MTKLETTEAWRSRSPRHLIERFGTDFAGVRLSPGTAYGESAAEQWLQLAPTLAELEEGARLVRQALDAPAEDRAAKMLIGLLLSAFPNTGKQIRDEYFATMVFDVVSEGYGPAMVAEACRILRQTAIFLPTVSEMLRQCGEARQALEQADMALAEAVSTWERVEEVLAVAALAPDDLPEDAWRNAADEWRSRPVGFRSWNDRLGPPPNVPGTRFPEHLRAVYRWPDLEAAV